MEVARLSNLLSIDPCAYFVVSSTACMLWLTSVAELCRVCADSRHVKVARLSNLLSIDPSAYDPATSEPPREEEYVDEEGKRRVRIRNQNSIRWRARALPDGSTVRESNARCGAACVSKVIQTNAAWRRAYLHQACCKQGLYGAFVRAACGCSN